ncbi:hypothetical protein EVAR_3462_1 [Eumeta japonica]|uniref:Uncharacterized protein n=1 Tax=Eumeta variegata TaxID=151549 RepID=A0A4C1STA5_EUMVA|nr:hypothetical protein EVAR_3462_1 [Eumeta japonica]
MKNIEDNSENCTFQAFCNGGFSYYRVSPHLGFLSQSPRKTDFLQCVDSFSDDQTSLLQPSFICGGWSTTAMDAFFFVLLPVQKGGRRRKTRYGSSEGPGTRVCPTLTD